MEIRKLSLIVIWSFLLIILTSTVFVEAAKSTSRRRGSSSSKKSPNYDHVALTHHGGSSQVNRQHQTHTQQTHTSNAHAPSAPALPSAPAANNNNNNKPIGWNVPHTDTVNQPKTVSQTHSALPYPQNPPPYQQNAGFNPQHSAAAPPAGPPPPYSANSNPAFNSHPPAGPPPPYSQNANPSLTSHGHEQPPAYQPNQPGYPQQNYHPGAATPQHIPPSSGQAPVINNHYYGQPQSGLPISGGSIGGGGGGGSGPSLLGTALAAGAGSLAGNALYGALKPNSDPKTIIVHENAPVAQAPVPTSPSSPIQPAVASAPSTVSVPLATEQPTVAQQVPDTIPPSTVPLAPLPDQASSSMAPPPPPPSPTMPEIQSAPVADPTTIVPSTSTSTNVPVVQTTQMRMMENATSPAVTSSTVPLAPFPSDTSAQAQKGDANSFVIFNMSVYTIISVLIVGLF